MITFKDALRLIKDNTGPLETVGIGLDDAGGSVLAEDIFSDIDMPPFDKSFRDGYAVRSSDIGSVPITLEVVGESKAGGGFSGTVETGQAVEIMTGSPVPNGADAVVMVEDTQRLSDGEVKIDISLKSGSFMCRRGSDIGNGDRVLPGGTLIREAEAAVLAAVGKGKVLVYRKPRISVITTGDELVDISNRPEGSSIRNSNGPLLINMIRDDGLEVDNLGIVIDDPDELKSAVKKGLENDILLLSGGVSAGKYDYVPEIVESLGVEKVFHKVAMKPGKPNYFGKLGRKAIFGMPGNPVSVFLSYKVFVKTAINLMMGDSKPPFEKFLGKTMERIFDKSRREVFVPVLALYEDGEWKLNPAGWRGSADIISLSKSNAFAILPAGVTEIPAGGGVEFFRWD